MDAESLHQQATPQQQQNNTPKRGKNHRSTPQKQNHQQPPPISHFRELVSQAMVPQSPAIHSSAPTYSSIVSGTANSNNSNATANASNSHLNSTAKKQARFASPNSLVDSSVCVHSPHIDLVSERGILRPTSHANIITQTTNYAQTPTKTLANQEARRVLVSGTPKQNRSPAPKYYGSENLPNSLAYPRSPGTKLNGKKMMYRPKSAAIEGNSSASSVSSYF